MHQITINVNQSIYEHIMFFLKNLPKNLIDIEFESKNQNTPISLSKFHSTSSDAFGILNGRIKDPMQWQRDIREESDRDIYRDFSK